MSQCLAAVPGGSEAFVHAIVLSTGYSFMWLLGCLAFCIILSCFLLAQLVVSPSSQICQERSGCVCAKFLHLPPKAALGLSLWTMKNAAWFRRGVSWDFPHACWCRGKGTVRGRYWPLHSAPYGRGGGGAFRRLLLPHILTEYTLCARHCSGP